MISKEKIDKLPFDIDPKSDRLVCEANGISEEEQGDLLSEFATEQNNVIKLSEMDVGKKLTIAGIRRSYDTSNGSKDLIMFVHLENIGKPYDEEYNQIEAQLLKIEIVDVDEVTDTYLDFMTMIKELKAKQES